MSKKRFVSSPSVRLLAVLAVALVFVERPLEAYADPGSGLLVWQLLGALIVGGVFQFRRAMRKLRALTPFRSRHKSSSPHTPEICEGKADDAILS